MSILGRISELVLNKEFKGKHYAVGSLVLLNSLALLPMTTFANTDSLGGVPEKSTSVSDVVETTTSLSRDEANNILKSVREAIPQTTQDHALDQINKAVNTNRDASWDLAASALAPVGYGLMFLANFFWGLATFGYFFQTSVDVLCLVWSGPREYFMNKTSNQDQQGFSITGFIGSFFTLSYDARQIIESAGLSSSAPQNQGGMNRGMGSPMGGMGSPMGGMNGMGSPMGMNRGMGMGMGQGAQNKPMVSTGNLLSRYISLHMKTLVALGVAFVIFGTSFATEFQGQAVSLIIAIIKGAINLVIQLWHQFVG